MAYIYQNSAWAAYDTEKYVVNTNTFTTYPFTIKSPTTPVNATIYGNMMQTGTPTPTNPIQPSECGDLETMGEYADQYKIPISSASTITPIYLGEVQSTRQIKKLVLTGQENWNMRTDDTHIFYLAISGVRTFSLCLASHYKFATTSIPANLNSGEITTYLGQGVAIWTKNDGIESANDYKTWLSQQYNNGTPVTVWYVLAEPTTGIVNEPIRKIGDYADTVTTSIPVTINSDSVDINTTLKPSAVAAPSLSWSAGDDYKRSSGAWS